MLQEEMACYSSPDLTWPLAASSLLSLFPPPASRKEASYIRFPHSGSRPCTRQVFCVNRFLSTYQVFFPLSRSPTWLTVLFLMHVKPTTQYPSWLIYSLSLSLSLQTLQEKGHHLGPNFWELCTVKRKRLWKPLVFSKSITICHL